GAAVAVHVAHSAPDETIAALDAAGATSSVVHGDLGDTGACERVVDEAAAALGGLDLLVNNAGVTTEVAFAKTTPELFDSLFGLNVRGYFFCAQRALAHFG